MANPDPYTLPADGTEAPPPSFAWRAFWPWVFFLVPAISGVILDLATKAWAFPKGIDPTTQLNGRHPFFPALQIIPGILEFVTTVNHGAVFGFWQNKGFLFIPFSFVALGAVLVTFARSRKPQWVLHLSLGLITAGAMGNLYDRILLNCVRDFMRFPLSWFQYIFNVADVLLCIGVPLLLLCWIFAPTPKKPA